jgi:hypothetical protein
MKNGMAQMTGSLKKSKFSPADGRGGFAKKKRNAGERSASCR